MFGWHGTWRPQSRKTRFTSPLCPPLKRLSVSLEEDFRFRLEDICVVDKEVKAVELQKWPPCHLEYLQSDSPRFMCWLLVPQTMIYISTIRTLDTWCGTEHMEGLMARLTKGLGSSLEDLTSNPPEPMNGVLWDFFPFSLSLFPFLFLMEYTTWTPSLLHEALMHPLPHGYLIDASWLTWWLPWGVQYINRTPPHVQ